MHRIYHIKLHTFFKSLFISNHIMNAQEADGICRSQFGKFKANAVPLRHQAVVVSKYQDFQG